MRRLLAIACGALALAAGGAAATQPLTGYGATRKVWYAHHKVQKSAILLPGCCFGPAQNDGQYRYYNLQYALNRVSYYNMDFGPRVSASDARKRMKKELPADAKLVAHKRRGDCEQFAYRSAALRRAVGDSHVGVEFASDVKGGKYDGKVRKVTVSSLVSIRYACGA
jgi:hypothetical protein